MLREVEDGAAEEEKEMEQEKKAGLGGEHYIPYEERKGNESIVYFTRDLSAEGLIRLYEKIKENLTGRVAVKLHTGEQHGPNIIPRPWVKELMEKGFKESLAPYQTYGGQRTAGMSDSTQTVASPRASCPSIAAEGSSGSIRKRSMACSTGTRSCRRRRSALQDAGRRAEPPDLPRTPTTHSSASLLMFWAIRARALLFACW